MSAESESNERIFTIPKQTFRQKVPVKHSWTVKLKARDQFGDEEEHEWQLHTMDWHRQNFFFLSFDGSVKEIQIKYEKFSCKVQIFDDNGAKIKSIKQNDRRLQPTINSFTFLDICNFAYDGDIFPLSVDFSFTIGSRDRIKSKPFERQKMMLDEGILTDMVIKTKDRELPCHKFVLAVESEYFRIMFQTEMKEKETNILDWTGVFEAPVVQDLLHFLYTLEKPPNLKDNHFELIDAAHLCLLPKLKNMCAESIGDVIQVDNAARVLQTAELFGLENLKKSAIKFLFVSSNWKQVVATEFFQKLDPTFYKTMLESVLSEVDKNFVVKK